MKLGSTLVLKSVIVCLGIAVSALCVFGLPQLIASEFDGDFDYGWIFVGLYVTAIPFFYGLYQALKLLDFIDKKEAFTVSAVSTLRKIKFAVIGVSGLYLLGMPYVFTIADRDDAPGLVALGLVIIGTSGALATAVAVIQKLFQSALEIKSENDLTV